MSANNGTDLAKVLWYYNQIYDVNTIQQKIVCPFHDDVNPSMIVNLADGSWYCFGCGLSGNAQKFVYNMESKHHGLNDLQAYKKYLAILKSDKVSDIKISPRLRRNRPNKKSLYDESYMYYHGLRKVDWNHDNIEEVLEIKQYMLARGFTPDTLNLAKAKITYQWAYGLIFPMLDNGKFKGWVSRTIRSDVAERRKYLYNTGFSRATTLVGNYGHKQSVIVVEGYMDYLKFRQYGIDNVVAILGWKASGQQIQKLKDAGISIVISALDNDHCGKKGSKYLSTIEGFTVIRWQYLKCIKDPGDMSQIQFNKMYRKTNQVLKQEGFKNGIN